MKLGAMALHFIFSFNPNHLIMSKLEFITEGMLFKIRQHQQELPEALRRAALADYREGVFSITINTRDRRPLLGFIRNGEFYHSKVGQAVAECWQKIPEYYPQAELIIHQVMPEHFHGLLRLNPKKPNTRIVGKSPAHLGRIVGGFMIGSTHAYWNVLGIDWKAYTWSKAQRKEPFHLGVEHKESTQGPALFERGYNDVVPISDEQIDTKIRYIATNVERRQMKRDNSDFFAITRNAKSANWTVERIKQGLLADRFIGKDAASVAQAWQKIAPMLNLSDRCTPTIDWLGNKSLLTATTKVSVICHRADVHLFEQQKAKTIEAAKNGAIVVSACINPKEREIVKALQAELLPVIKVADNGFDTLYKPSGKAFYTCAEGALTEITPWKHRTVSKDEEQTLSREMCLTANELVRIVALCPDTWWK